MGVTRLQPSNQTFDDYFCRLTSPKISKIALLTASGCDRVTERPTIRDIEKLPISELGYGILCQVRHVVVPISRA
jgi:hypothetical protein